MNGQDTGAGWSRQTAQAVTPSGIAHQRIAGRTVNGISRSRTLGGYSTSPIRMAYGPASW